MRSFISLLIGSCFCILPGLMTGNGSFAVSAFEDSIFSADRESEATETNGNSQLPEAFVEPEKQPQPFPTNTESEVSRPESTGKLQRSDNVAQLPVYLANGETAGQVSEVVLTDVGELAYVVLHYRHQDYFVPPRYLKPGQVGGTLEMLLGPGEMEAIPKFWSHRWPSLSDPELPLEIESHFVLNAETPRNSSSGVTGSLSQGYPGMQTGQPRQPRHEGTPSGRSMPQNTVSGPTTGTRPSLDLKADLVAPEGATEPAVPPLVAQPMGPATEPMGTTGTPATNGAAGAGEPTPPNTVNGAIVVPATGAGVAAGRAGAGLGGVGNVNNLNSVLFGNRGGAGANGGISTGVGNSLPAMAFPNNTAGSATTISGGGTSQVRSPQANPTIIGQPGVIGTNGGTAVIAPSNSIGAGTAGEATVINGAIAPQNGAAAIQNRGNVVGTSSNSSQFPTTSNSAIINSSRATGNVGASTSGGNNPNRSGLGNGVNNVNSTGTLSGGRSGVSPSNRATIGGGPSPTTGSQSPGGAPIQPAASPSTSTGTGATGTGAGNPR